MSSAKDQIFFRGFGDTYKVEGLDPLHSYKYRLRMMSKDVDAGVSSTVTVCTTSKW